MEWMKIVSPLVFLVLKPLKAVTEHVAYPFKVSSNIISLESETRRLKAERDDIQTKIINAERESGTPTEVVKLWLEEVENIEQKAEDIQQNYQQLRRCMWNISPNVWFNYKISRSAAKKQLKVKSLRDNRPTNDLIIQMLPPFAQEMPASLSKSINLEQTLQYIRDDASSIIGIWGMGGIGKTHLLKQINNELSRDNIFNVVVFITCSKDCPEEKIQDKIINKLGLCKCDNMEQKQSTIYNFLSQRSFVLLFDDLWNRVDLDTIGIPNLLGKRKVVLTTRSTEICGQMEVRKIIKIDVLNEDDAWSLFKEKATEETINSDPIIQKLALEVANELGRLPLALITVGRTMHDKMDPREWEQAVLLLSQARIYDVEFSSSDTSIFHKLRFSYDSLKSDTLKQCFLHCSLWPEDWKIENRNLVELWMGLGLIDDSEIHIAYNIGYSYIRRLQAVCLLEESENESIKMHDVIRDMALWIATNQGIENHKWIVQAGTLKQNQVIKVLHDTEKLSLVYNRTEKLSCTVPCSSTKLSTLLLGENRLKDVGTLCLESFCGLKVLDLSGNDLKTFPTEVCKLDQLQFLNLSWNRERMSLPKEFEALINLKYLFLRAMRCTIPKGLLSRLKSLRVLDTIYSEIGTEIFSSIVEELQCLPEFQALGISVEGKKYFQEISQMRVPVRWLQLMHIYEDYLSLTSCFLGNSQLQSNLIDLYIGEKTTKWVIFEKASSDCRICCLEKLEQLTFHMHDMEEVVWKGLNPKDVFPTLRVLIFDICTKLESISWIVYLPCIQELHLRTCIRIKQLINNVDDAIRIRGPFPFLKKMILVNNPQLERISNPKITFPALEFLEIVRCNKLKELNFQTDKPPRELKLRGTEEWWNSIEMEDSSHKTLLQPFFHEVPIMNN